MFLYQPDTSLLNTTYVNDDLQTSVSAAILTVLMYITAKCTTSIRSMASQTALMVYGDIKAGCPNVTSSASREESKEMGFF